MMNCEMNQLSMPDGSSTFMLGNTCIVAGVYGPIEARLQKMMYDKASIEVVFSPLKGPPSIADREKELFIKEICESTLIVTLHPGTAISVNLQEVEDDGGLMACAINAASLALINSGLAMKFCVAAVHCMIDEESKEILLHPTSAQLKTSKASFTFAFDSLKKNIVHCHSTGSFSQSEFTACIEKCKTASSNVFDFYREMIKKYSKFI